MSESGSSVSNYTRPILTIHTGPNEDDIQAQECLIQCGGVDFHFVVFGKSGTGKSSLCNQLANRDLQDVLKFRVGSGLSTVTVQCQQEPAVSPDGQLRFTVIDVPGESLDSHTKKFSLEKFVEKLQQHIRDNKELTSNADRRCKTVIIVCVRCDARYAAEEFRTYQELKVIWDDDQDFCERLMVAFTHGDKLVGDASDDEDDTKSMEQPVMSAADNAEGRSKETDTKTCDVDADNRAGKLAVKGEGSTNRAADIETSTRAERILAEKLKATWPQLNTLLSDCGNIYVLFNNKKGHKDKRSVLILLQIVQKMKFTGVPNPKRGNRAGIWSSSLVRADGGKGGDGWKWINLFFLCLRILGSSRKSRIFSCLFGGAVVVYYFRLKKIPVSSKKATDVTTKTVVCILKRILVLPMVWLWSPYAFLYSIVSEPFPQLNVSSYFGYVSYVSYLQAHWGWWIF